MEKNIISNLFQKFKPVGKKILFLVPALNIDNAIEVNQALDGTGFVAVSAKDFPDAESLAEEAKQVQERLGAVSIALGKVNFTQTKKVVSAALLTRPDHINLPFQSASYAQGQLHQAGIINTIINGLVYEPDQKDNVIIKVEKDDSEGIINLPIRDAMELLAGWGIRSVKTFFSKQGDQLNWLANITRAAKESGLELIEPTSGISEKNIIGIIRACQDSGGEYMLLHVFSSLIDKNTGLTKPEAVSHMVEMVKERFP